MKQVITMENQRVRNQQLQLLEHLAWIKATAFGGDNNPIGVDSGEWGNYSDITFTYGAGLTKELGSSVLINTGETTVPENRHMKNNIYDLAGNLWEWTQENASTDTEIRVVRGGKFSTWSEQAAAARYNVLVTGSDYNVGFRPALYIK